jgi:hypothetical protein
MKMTRSEFLNELEKILQTISRQRSNTAERKKELAEFKNLQLIDKGFKAVLHVGRQMGRTRDSYEVIV